MRKVGAVLLGLAFIAVAAFGYRAYLISELRKPMLSELNDPGSAEFRSEVLLSPWAVSGSILCGEVNAKNRMGGYAGFSEFYVDTMGGEPIVEIGSEPAKRWCDMGDGNVPWWWLRW